MNKGISNMHLQGTGPLTIEIHVHVSGSKVKLDGKVHSFYQKEEAGRIAWNAPGVLVVDNELVIEYD